MPRFVLALAAICFLPFGVNSAKAEIVVNISKSQQRLAVVIDGTEAYRWPVSTGRRGYDTPVGNFRPHDIERHWYSRQYQRTPMPWAIFFHRGYAVHAAIEAYNLGHVASHGCVRLRADNAAILFSLVRRRGLQDTRVVVMKGPLPAAPGAKPAADAGVSPAAERFAKALGAGEELYAARAQHHFAMAADDDNGKAVKHGGTRHAADYRVSVGSDEAKILRERTAWLRSIDRKFGITR